VRETRAQLEALAEPSQRDASLGTLRASLATWAELDFGLGEPIDPDLTLASVLAWSAFVTEQEGAEELALLLQGVRALCPQGEHPAPALALALARGWLALSDPRARPVEVDRADELAFALRAAEAVPAADGRDSLGCLLALEHFELLVSLGRRAQALAALGDALARFADDLDVRPYLLCRLADERRVSADWSAWTALGEAESAREALAARGGVPVELERLMAGTRCQLELACGLLDQAVVTLERERKAVAGGATGPEDRLGWLFDESSVALASTQRVPLERAIEHLDAALAEQGLFADRPGYRAMVLARRALLEDMRADVAGLAPGADPAQRSEDVRRASAWLERALAAPDLDATHRAELALRLELRAQRVGDLALAEERLALFPSSNVPPELAATLDAVRASVALLRKDDGATLAGHRARLEAHYRNYLDARRATPEREGGFGFQAWRNRRFVLGLQIELALALEGPAGIASVIDSLLEEQALGSLARRLSCAPGSLAEVRSELLADERGLLLYFPAGEGVHLFAIDATRAEHAYLEWSHEFEPGPRELVARLATSPADLSEAARARSKVEIEALAAELADRLLPAAARAALARWRGVYVVGLDLLGAVPFECLPLGDDPLGLRLGVTSLPSLPVGLALARRARARAGARAEPGEHGDELELLLVAAPEHEARFGAPIPFAPAAEERLGAGFARRTTLRGPMATSAGLSRALAETQPDALYLLVHGVNDPYRELSGGLVLSGGPTYGSELTAASFASPALVALAACGSARGPRRVGDDGVAQLAGAFFGSGAVCTVQAAGDLALEPTLAQLARLGTGIRQGESPAEALRAAREQLARVPRFDHPFYLQSLRVVGLGLSPLLSAPTSREPGR
jgi:hypothetical protein